MSFYCWQPLPVSRINWQILSREQSKQSLLKLPSSMSVQENLAGSHTVLLSQSRWVGACVCPFFFSCVCFHKKSQGVTEQIARGRPTSAPLCLPTKAGGGTAELPLASIFPYRRPSGRSPPPCFYSFHRINYHLLFSEANTKPSG